MSVSKNTTKIAANKRFPYIDVLNIIAILGVLFLHHNFGAENYDGTGRWALDVVTKVVFRYAVPIFIMITGATLLGYRQKYDTKTFFKKRFIKLLIPAMCWAVIMWAYQAILLHNQTFHDFSIQNIFRVLMNCLENDNYWFIFLILGIYLTMPIISFIGTEKHKKTLQYAILALFAFNSLFPALCSLFNLAYSPFLSVNVGRYLIYIFLGFYIHTFDILKRYRIIIYFASFVSLILNYLLTICISNSRGSFFDLFNDNIGPLAVIYTSGIFLLIKNLIKTTSKRASKVLSTLSGCSFGVYLSHMLIMHYEVAILRNLFSLQTSSWVYRFLCPFLTYVLCVVIVLILKKIPVLRKIVP